MRLIVLIFLIMKFLEGFDLIEQHSNRRFKRRFENKNLVLSFKIDFVSLALVCPHLDGVKSVAILKLSNNSGLLIH